MNNASKNTKNKIDNIDARDTTLEHADKKNNSKIIRDFGYIKIGEKFYEVNQSKASLNIIKSSLTLSTFFREYESIVKTIEVYNNAKDELLTKGYSENFEAEVLKLETSIANEKAKFSNLLESTEASLKALLTFYLGKDAMNKELAELSFIDSIKVCMELSSQIIQENSSNIGSGLKSRASKLGA